MSYVKVEKENKIATLTIEREEALNALNKDVLNDLKNAFTEVGDDPDILAVILTGKGRAFVAGADIAFMQDISVSEARDFTMFGQSVMSFIIDFPKPVIAAVNGFAFGGGFELALSCDFIIASEKAVFGLPELSLGIIPGFGGTQRLSRIIGEKNAKYFIYTSENIKADKALELGVVVKVVASDELLREVKTIANKILEKGPVAVKMAKSAVNNGLNADLKTGIQIEAECQSIAFSADDRKEGLKAFLEKRVAEFKGK